MIDPTRKRLQQFEEPGVRTCRFCPWSMTVTAVDKRIDTVDAYNRHILRHAQTITVEGAERAIFDSITRNTN